MKRIAGWVLVLALLAGGAWFWWQSRAIARPPGILAPRAPLQTDLTPENERTWRFGEYQVVARANYDIDARVLSTRRYPADPLTDICVLDLALGWGKMSDSAVLEHFKIWQQDRFFWWQSREGSMPLAQSELERSAANTHVIATSHDVDQKLSALRVGSLVRLRGILVDAAKPGQPGLRTSLRREDAGPGACEVLWVTSVETR